MPVPIRLLPALLASTLLACATPTPPTPTTAAPTPTSTAFATWTPATFARAKAEQRLIIVTVVTQWCHWCHVMDEKTWRDPAIAALVADRFVVVRVDADARPDLAERYADYGWPAVALLTSTAEPVTAWRGYREARAFEAELRGYIADVDAGRAIVAAVADVVVDKRPLAVVRDVMRAQLDRFYDVEVGGWGRPQKYPLWAPLAVALHEIGSGDPSRATQLATTLDGELGLIDDVDGGMFQYSLGGVWSAPHVEKLAEVNGNALRVFADAIRWRHEPRWRHGGDEIARYLTTTLRRADGAFFANQDADRAFYERPTREARAAVSAPFIDRHVFASHNGRIAAGLARFGAATGQPALVDAAAVAVDVILTNHRVGTGFTHDEGTVDDDVLHLVDQVAMGNALIELAEATGDRRYRTEARATAHFILDVLEDKAGGFFAHTVVDSDVGVFSQRRMPFALNAEAARLLLHVGRLEHDDDLVAAADRALARFADVNVVAAEYRAIGEMLLAADERLHEPLRFSVVTKNIDNDDSRALLAAVNAQAVPHRLVDVQLPGDNYPDLGHAVVYVCGESFCSAPVKDPSTLPGVTARFTR